MRILLFTGHLVDSKEREVPRFPANQVGDIGDLICKEIGKLVSDPAETIAVSSLAAGGDLLFAKEIIRKRIPLHVFLPFKKEDFLKISVNYPKKEYPNTPPINWNDEFEKIIKSANSVNYSSEEPYVREDQFQECNEKMLDYIKQKGVEYEADTKVIALLESGNENLTGGSTDFISKLINEQIPIIQIWLHTNQVNIQAEVNYDLMKKMVPVFSDLDEAAIVSQQSWRSSFQKSLLIIAGIALFSSFDGLEGEYSGELYKPIRLLAIIISIGGALAEIFFQIRDEGSHRNWIKYRAMAEQLRSEIWFLLYGFRPDNPTEVYSAQSWRNYLSFLNVNARLPTTDNEINTYLLKKIDTYQNLQLDEKVNSYLHFRVLDQLNYYSKKLGQLMGKRKRYKNTKLILLISAITWGSLMMAETLFSFHDLFKDLNLIGCLVALIAILTSLNDSEGVDELVLIYQNMRDGLVEIKRDVHLITTEKQFKAFVLETETFLRKQNDEWSFKRGSNI